jgi:GDPmannose 4,6-dehydratase
MRDWGFAGDYVRAMWLMLQQQHPDDYVVSTGIAHSVREFCEVAFGYLDLDYRDYVRSDPNSFRASEPTLLVGDATKARQLLSWKPEVSFHDLVTMMVESDLHQLRASNEAC